MANEQYRGRGTRGGRVGRRATNASRGGGRSQSTDQPGGPASAPAARGSRTGRRRARGRGSRSRAGGRGRGNKRWEAEQFESKFIYPNVFDFDYKRLDLEHQMRPTIDDDEEKATDATIEQWYADPYDRIEPDRAVHQVLGFEALMTRWHERETINVNKRLAKYARLKRYKQPSKEIDNFKTGIGHRLRTDEEGPDPDTTLEIVDGEEEIVEEDHDVPQQDDVPEDDVISEEEGDYWDRQPSSAATSTYQNVPAVETAPTPNEAVNTNASDLITESSAQATQLPATEVNCDNDFQDFWAYQDSAYQALTKNQKIAVLRHRIRMINEAHPNFDATSESESKRYSPRGQFEYVFDNNYWEKGSGSLKTDLKPRSPRASERYDEHKDLRYRRHLTQGHYPLSEVELPITSTIGTNGKHYGDTISVPPAGSFAALNSDLSWHLPNENARNITGARPRRPRYSTSSEGSKSSVASRKQSTSSRSTRSSGSSNTSLRIYSTDVASRRARRHRRSQIRVRLICAACEDEHGADSQHDHVLVYTEDPTFGIPQSNRSSLSERSLHSDFLSTDTGSERTASLGNESQYNDPQILLDRMTARVAHRVQRLRQLQAEAENRVHSAYRDELLDQSPVQDSLLTRQIAELSQQALESRLRNSRKRLRRCKEDRARAAENLAAYLERLREKEEREEQLLDDEIDTAAPSRKKRRDTLVVEEERNLDGEQLSSTDRGKKRADDTTEEQSSQKNKGKQRADNMKDEQIPQQNKGKRKADEGADEPKPKKQRRQWYKSTQAAQPPIGSAPGPSQVPKPDKPRQKKEKPAPQPHDIVEYRYKKMTWAEKEKREAEDIARDAARQAELMGNRTSAQEADRLVNEWNEEQDRRKGR